jgi:anti-anti-sigma regulatory factor
MEPRAGSACPFCREPIWFLRKEVEGGVFLTILAEAKHKTGPSVSCEAIYWILKNALFAVIDFSRLSEVSTGFLDALLAAQQKMKASGGVLKLCGLVPQVANDFHDADMDAAFEIYLNVEVALESIALMDDAQAATFPLQNTETVSEHVSFAV